ncbi:MAG: PTS transporter subunit EIIC [Erysipelotrichaceae bacterium]|nr:PTS transporter subunit EIIC [Erysipelotrichaceae bacterium]
MDNKKLCNEILEAVGGESNVVSVSHCMTRLRLTLADTAAAQSVDLIKKIQGVLGVAVLGDQYQIVIGPGVEQVYLTFKELGDFADAGTVDDPSAAREDRKFTIKSVFMTLLDFISGSFMPALSIIAAGGLMSALLVACSTLFGLSSDSGTYKVLNAIYDAAFTFLPIYVGFNTAQKLKVPAMLGALMGAVMVSSGINGVEGLSFLGIPITAVGYSSSILPAMFSVLFLSYVYKFFDRAIPTEVKFVLVPVLTMVISVPVALIAIGPLATWIGQIIASVILWIRDKLGWLSVGLMGAWCPIMLLTGTGAGLYPALFLSFAENGYEGFIMTGLLAANMAIGGAAIASSLKLKNPDNKSVAVSTGITAVFGITEPAIFGVLVPNKKPFLASIIGAGIGALFAGAMKVVEYSFASPGILTVVAFMNPDGSMNNFYMAIVTMIIAFVAAFAAAYVMGVEEEN